MPRHHRWTPLYGILLCIACSNSPILPEDGTVEQFVARGDLPNAQPPQMMFELPDFKARLFLASYGPPIECMPSTDPPSGPCFGSIAVGFEYRGRVGWLKTQPDPAVPPAPFVFGPKDEELYSAAFATAWRDADRGTYAETFTPALLRAAWLPRTTLLRLAHELRDWISTQNAHLLLQRAEVRGDTEILTIVAGLPVFQGDAYAHARQEAQGLLDIATHR